jgi:hypothetical protein
MQIFGISYPSDNTILIRLLLLPVCAVIIPGFSGMD